MKDLVQSNNQLLKCINKKIGSSSGSSSSKDFELLQVRDVNGDLFGLRPLLDINTDTYTFDFIDANGNVATPIQPVSFLDDSLVLANILTELQSLNTTQNSILAELTLQTTSLSSIDLNTDTVETLLAAQTLEIQNGNSANNTNLSNAITELQGINSNLTLQQTVLGNIISAVQTADVNNTGALTALQTTLQTDLAALLAQLTAINTNTDTLEAGQTTIANAIANNTVLTVQELQDIETLLTTSLVELQAINANTDTVEALLTSILNAQNGIILNTPVSSLQTGSGSTTSGVKAVMFTCQTGSEIINGVQRLEGQVIVFEYDNDTVGPIPYNANGGTIQIDIIV